MTCSDIYIFVTMQNLKVLIGNYEQMQVEEIISTLEAVLLALKACI